MTVEAAVALLGAVAAVLTALAAVFVQLNALNAQVKHNHELLNGQVTELLTVAQLAARKTGELEGRDWAAGVKAPPTAAEPP